MAAGVDRPSVPRENLRRVLLVRTVTASVLIAATVVAHLFVDVLVVAR